MAESFEFGILVLLQNVEARPILVLLMKMFAWHSFRKVQDFHRELHPTPHIPVRFPMPDASHQDLVR
jgi:hypothetical protein